MEQEGGRGGMWGGEEGLKMAGLGREGGFQRGITDVGGEEGMSLFGLAARRDLGSNPLRLSFRFKSCGLWTLSLSLCPSQLMKH